NNIFIFSQSTGKIKKLTNIKSGDAPNDNEDSSDSDKTKWLESENLKLLKIVNERKDKQEASKAFRESVKEKEPFAYYSGRQNIINLQVSPDAKYVSFNVYSGGDSDGTIVPDYIDASGYTVNLNTRSKVGDDQTKVDLMVYNIEKDTVYKVTTDELTGISDLPDYTKDYPDKEWEVKPRDVITSRAYFSDNGAYAIVNVRSKDNKDRWIAKLDLTTGSLTTLDRQRDDAWIAGPGIGCSMGGGTLGWLPDNKHIY